MSRRGYRRTVAKEFCYNLGIQENKKTVFHTPEFSSTCDVFGISPDAIYQGKSKGRRPLCYAGRKSPSR